MFDRVIQNAWIYDGSGAPPFFGDVAIENGKIAAVGTNLGSAEVHFNYVGLHFVL